MKLPLAILDAMGVRAPRPKTSLGFAGRARMLELWDRMDADQQDQALLVVEGILGRETVVRAEPTGAYSRREPG